MKILGFHSYVCWWRQLLTTKNKEKRVKRGKRIMSFLKKKRQSTVLVFSDKKNWTVDQARNARNDRYLAFHVEEVPSINVTKHPQSAMMLGVICSEGKRMPPYWFQKGLKVGGKEEYLSIMQDVVKPVLDENYPRGNNVWQ